MFTTSMKWTMRRLIIGVSAGSLAGGSVSWCSAGKSGKEDGGTSGKENGLLSSQKESIVGLYENRLRRHAPPEKVFEYFASVELDGEWYMTPNDFVRTIIPYNAVTGGTVGTSNFNFQHNRRLRLADEEVVDTYDQLVASGLQGNKQDLKTAFDMYLNGTIEFPAHRKILAKYDKTHRDFHQAAVKAGVFKDNAFYTLVDQDGDGLISFGEYMVFITLLAVPRNDIDLAFKVIDVNNDKFVTLPEFQSLMKTMRQRFRAGRQVRDKSVFGGDLGRLDKGAGMKQLFKTPDHKLTEEEFTSFLTKLHRALHEKEFSAYDVDGSGALTALEFAAFLCARLSDRRTGSMIARAKSYTKRLELQGKKMPLVTMEDFISLYNLLSSLDELETALSLKEAVAGASLGAKQLRKAMNATLRATSPESKPLSEECVEVIIALFDKDGDGQLQAQGELLHLLRAHQSHGLDESSYGSLDYIRRIIPCATTRLLGLE